MTTRHSSPLIDCRLPCVSATWTWSGGSARTPPSVMPPRGAGTTAQHPGAAKLAVKGFEPLTQRI